MPLYAITGSATEDGRPIYRTTQGDWSSRVADARLHDDESSREATLTEARNEQRVVCDPYAIEVEVIDATPSPLRLKERIRANGPTVDVPRR